MRLENNLNNLNRDQFISLFRVIFEKTLWIAEKLFELKPFKDKNDLEFVHPESKEIENCEKLFVNEIGMELL